MWRRRQVSPLPEPFSLAEGGKGSWRDEHSQATGQNVWRSQEDTGRAATGAGETEGNRGMSLRKRKTLFFFPTFSIRRVQGANMEKIKIKPEFTAEPQN